MSLLTPQQSRTNGPSGQDVDEFKLIWEYFQGWQPPVSTKVARGLVVGGVRVQAAATCGLGNHCQCVYYSCPVRDSEAQNCSHQGNRQWSWVSVHTPCALDYYSILQSCQNTNRTWAFEENMLPNHLLTCWVKGYEHDDFWRNAGWLESTWKKDGW